MKDFSRNFDYGNKTYCSRPRIGNLASVLCPLIVMSMLMGERPIEDIADVSH